MNTYLFGIMLINAAELALLDTLFCVKLEKRRGFWLRCGLCLGMLLTYLLFAPLDKMSFLIHAPILAISFFYLGFCYRCNMVTVLYFGTAGYTVQRIASLCNSIISHFAPEQLSHWIWADQSVGPYGFLLIFLCDAVVFTIAYFVLIKRLWSMALLPETTVPVVVLTVIVMTMNQVWTSDYILGEAYNASPVILIEYAWNLVCCVLSLGVQFGIFGISRRDYEKEITKKMIAEKEQQYRISKSTMEAVNRKSHDLKYQLSAFSAGQAGQRELDEAFALVDSFDTNIHTGNETLDVIFTEKNQFCQQHGITFVCMIDGEKLSFMETTDQYVLFGNMIDNAINAVMKLPEDVERSIYITVRQEKKLLLIQTENPFMGKLEFRDGLPRTTSGDEFNHGYGMSSIRLLCEKYGGSVSAKARDGVFYLNIVIPVE